MIPIHGRSGKNKSGFKIFEGQDKKHPMDIRHFLYPIALILPIYMAARYSFHGIVIGGLIIWSLVGAAILVDTQSLGLGWPFLILWIAFGLPVGMLYSATTSAFIMLIWRMLFGRGS